MFRGILEKLGAGSRVKVGEAEKIAADEKLPLETQIDKVTGIIGKLEKKRERIVARLGTDDFAKITDEKGARELEAVEVEISYAQRVQENLQSWKSGFDQMDARNARIESLRENLIDAQIDLMNAELNHDVMDGTDPSDEITARRQEVARIEAELRNVQG